MTRYAIIAAAIIVGALIGWLLARPKKPAADETLVEEKQKISLLPFVAGLIVLMLGLFLLADWGRSPIGSTYKPAVIDNGAINPGHFDGQDKGNHGDSDQ